MTSAVEIRPDTVNTRMVLDTADMQTLRERVGAYRRDHMHNMHMKYIEEPYAYEKYGMLCNI